MEDTKDMNSLNAKPVRWQYLTFEEQQKIRNPRPVKQKPVKKKLNIEKIKVTLPKEEKLFSAKDWVANLKKQKH